MPSLLCFVGSNRYYCDIALIVGLELLLQITAVLILANKDNTTFNLSCHFNFNFNAKWQTTQ